MLLRELFEAKGHTTVGIIFGRFNPPHKGHRAAWEMAAQNDHWFVGTNKSTEGPKDPLPFKVKVEAMKTIYPELEGHVIAEQSWLTMASKIFAKYGEVILNVYTDEDWVTKTLLQYNGKESAHGFYNFPSIQQHPTPRLSSATALRAAVLSGDRQEFTSAAGVDANTEVAGYPFFDLVSNYLMPYQNIPKKAPAKKKAVTEKKDGTYIPVTNKCPYCKRSEDKCLCSKKEDAAGVGIITKQNSTADVNKGTPRKNLKAFRLV